MPPTKVTIVVVSYNAPRYAAKLLRSLRTTRLVRYELVVVDNHSRLLTRLLWTLATFRGRVNRLALLDQNTYFAQGCNIGAALAARDSTHLLLLNTDCEIRDPEWLAKMIAVNQGATGLRYIDEPGRSRADGFCFLLDRALWKDGLDESFPWWWSATALQARLLAEGHHVQAVADYEDLVVHHSGKSGDAWKKASNARGESVDVDAWFAGRSVNVVDRLR